jgi:hypothetical protein
VWALAVSPVQRQHTTTYACHPKVKLAGFLPVSPSAKPAGFAALGLIIEDSVNPPNQQYTAPFFWRI